VPVLNFNAKPFNGEKFNDQVLKRAEMWRHKEEGNQDQGILDKQSGPR
jgi:hypothetical protein